MKQSIIIADSGSTKTDWEYVSGDDRLSWTTDGLNPYFHTRESIRKVVAGGKMSNNIPDAVSSIHFYGSGYGDPEHRDLIRDVIKEIWMDTEVNVSTDLLGAARACLGSDRGVACIIGTGSNSCLYDGLQITDHIPSLGFIFGDEGSGSWIGKELIRRYFYREFPEDLSAMFESEFEMNRDVILKTVYHKPQANRYIAGFANFTYRHRKHPYIRQLLRRGFELFVRSQVLKYEDIRSVDVGFVGSIAFLHQDILSRVLIRHELKPRVFVKSPMEGLVTYHLEKQSDV